MRCPAGESIHCIVVLSQFILFQANDSSTPPNMRELLYKLAHRLLTSAWNPLEMNADRFHLYLSLLLELQLYDEARAVLESDQGKSICSRSLACDELRRDIWKAKGWLKEEGEAAEKRISDKYVPSKCKIVSNRTYT